MIFSRAELHHCLVLIATVVEKDGPYAVPLQERLERELAEAERVEAARERARALVAAVTSAP